jgi:hypothetical protein
MRHGGYVVSKPLSVRAILYLIDKSIVFLKDNTLFSCFKMSK